MPKKETLLPELPVERRPSTVASDHPVEKQRAIVKPHILTHVIEGFVIQEGPEPFPVSRQTCCNCKLQLKQTPPNIEKVFNQTRVCKTVNKD